jgi:hypothetical protein
MLTIGCADIIAHPMAKGSAGRPAPVNVKKY